MTNIVDNSWYFTFVGGSYRGDQALVNVMMMSFSTFADQILEKRESEIFFCVSSRCWLLGERWREWLLSSLQLTAATELSSLIVWWRFKTITSCVVENSTNSGKEKTDNWIKGETFLQKIYELFWLLRVAKRIKDILQKVINWKIFYHKCYDWNCFFFKCSGIIWILYVLQLLCLCCGMVEQILKVLCSY